MQPKPKPVRKRKEKKPYPDDVIERQIEMIGV